MPKYQNTKGQSHIHPKGSKSSSKDVNLDSAAKRTMTNRQKRVRVK